jgi:FkbM family methyltransferase
MMNEYILREENRLIWEFLNCSEDGFFIEVGAGDPVNLSVTYHLEVKGWKGILVEPQPELTAKLKDNRKAKVWSVACGSLKDRGEADFFVAGEFSSLKKHAAFTDVIYSDKIAVPVITLDEILYKEGNPKIDFLSIDVEGTELNVLKGIDLLKNRPQLIFIEYHVLSLDVHYYLSKNKYKLVQRTGVNNWYIPIENGYDIKPIDRLKLFRKMYLGTPLRKLQFIIKKHTKHRKFRNQ